VDVDPVIDGALRAVPSRRLAALNYVAVALHGALELLYDAALVAALNYVAVALHGALELLYDAVLVAALDEFAGFDLAQRDPQPWHRSSLEPSTSLYSPHQFSAAIRSNLPYSHAAAPSGEPAAWPFHLRVSACESAPHALSIPPTRTAGTWTLCRTFGHAFSRMSNLPLADAVPL
jgi:hypothetical protein